MIMDQCVSGGSQPDLCLELVLALRAHESVIHRVYCQVGPKRGQSPELASAVGTHELRGGRAVSHHVQSQVLLLSRTETGRR